MPLHRSVVVLLLLVAMVLPTAPAAAEDVLTRIADNATEDRPGPVVAIGADDLPVLHTRFEGVGTLTRCDDPACVAPNPTTTVMEHIDVLLLDDEDRPILVADDRYYSVTEDATPRILVQACEDRACAVGDPRPVDLPHTDVQLVDAVLDAAGNPVLLYADIGVEERDSGNDVTTAALHVARCADRTCGTVAVAEVSATREALVPVRAALTLAADDRPVVARPVSTTLSLPECEETAGTTTCRCDGSTCSLDSGPLEVVACGDPACTSTAAPAVVGSPGSSAGFSVSATTNGDGNPVLVYQDATATHPLTVATCPDPACAGSVTVVRPTGVAGSASGIRAVTAADGTPTVVFRGEGFVNVLDCVAVDCVGGGTIGRPAADHRDIWVALDGADNPFLGLSGRDEDVDVIRCDDPACLGSVPPPPPGCPDPTVEVGPGAVAHAVDVSARFADVGEPPPAATASYAVLATVCGFADALSAAVLTADGPLLLTAPGRLDPTVAAELERVLGSEGTVYLMGGAAALGPEVEAQVAAMGLTPVRLAGPTRFETSRAVVDVVVERFGMPDRVALARGTAPADNPTAAWADSITGGAWAADRAVPILLTPTDALHPAAADGIDAVGADVIHLLGGTAALSPSYDALPGAVRTAGDTRFGTARAIARELWGLEEEGERLYLILDATDPAGWAYGLPAAGLAAAGSPLRDEFPMLAVGGTAPPETVEAVAGCDVGLIGVGPLVLGVLEELRDGRGDC